MVRPSTPTKPALPTSACRLVQRRATLPAATSEALSDSPMTAKARLTSLMLRPIALACPPLTPAKACSPLAPMSSMSTATGVLDSLMLPVAATSASVTLPLFFSMPKAPEVCTKPNTSSVSMPVALSSWPSPASRFKVRLLGAAVVPVLMSRPRAM